MDLFEFLIALSVAVIMPLAIAKLIVDYKRDRMEVERSRSQVQDALTVGELKQMVHEAVDESYAELSARIDAIEERAFGAADVDAQDKTVGAAQQRTLGRRTS